MLTRLAMRSVAICMLDKLVNSVPQQNTNAARLQTVD